MCTHQHCRANAAVEEYIEIQYGRQMKQAEHSLAGRIQAELAMIGDNKLWFNL